MQAVAWRVTVAWDAVSGNNRLYKVTAASQVPHSGLSSAALSLSPAALNLSPIRVCPEH